MPQSFQCLEGIILRVFPYGEYDQIITLFTAEAGVVKLFFKGSRSQKKGVQGICIPLTGVQVVFKERNSELFSCQEITLMESFRFLRTELIHLETACDLLQVIYTSQLPGKPAPHLYALLLYFLERIPQCTDPSVLTASFRLKLLKHDGVVSFPMECSHCQEPLLTAAFHEEEPFCEAHRPPGSLRFNGEELMLLDHLTNSQSFQTLSHINLTADFKEKLERFCKRVG